MSITSKNLAAVKSYAVDLAQRHSNGVYIYKGSEGTYYTLIVDDSTDFTEALGYIYTACGDTYFEEYVHDSIEWFSGFYRLKKGEWIFLWNLDH